MMASQQLVHKNSVDQDIFISTLMTNLLQTMITAAGLWWRVRRKIPTETQL